MIDNDICDTLLLKQIQNKKLQNKNSRNFFLKKAIKSDVLKKCGSKNSEILFHF